MVVQALTREALFQGMDEARRAAQYLPDGRERQERIDAQRDRFERLPGHTVPEMSQQCIETAEAARKTGQAWRILSLLAGGGLMVAGYASEATGMMAIGLGVMLGGGHLVANHFDGRARKQIGDFSALQQWDKELRLKENNAPSQVDEMLHTLKTRLERGDLDAALAEGRAILQTEEEVVVGDHAIRVN